MSVSVDDELRLRRLLAVEPRDSEAWRDLALAAVDALPMLLDDLNAAKKDAQRARTLRADDLATAVKMHNRLLKAEAEAKELQDRLDDICERCQEGCFHQGRIVP